MSTISKRDVDKALDDAIATFRKLGARIVQVELPDQTLVSAAALIVIAVEAASHHAPWLRTRAKDYGEQVRNRLINGLPSARSSISRRCAGAARRSPRILRPSANATRSSRPPSRSVAPTIAETDVGGGPNAEAVILGVTRFMRPVNYLGLPALMCRPASASTACRSACSSSAGRSATRP